MAAHRLAPNAVDLTGKRFGRFIVLSPSEYRGKTRNIHWRCLCDCGQEFLVPSNHIKNGHTKSCGCLNLDRIVERNTKHGHSRRGAKSGTHRTWQAMWTRCTNERQPRYKNYGGSGITVCQRWRDFKNFLADMGERPAGKSLDRIDPFGNYEPGNCRWATQKEQCNNKRIHHRKQ